MRFIYLLIAALVFVHCHGQVDNSSFSLSEITPTILEEKGVEIFQYWDLSNNDALWRPNDSATEEISRYANALQDVLGEERYKMAVDKEARQGELTGSPDEIENGDEKNAFLIHNGTLGKIRSINVLEAQILNYQLARYPLFSHPTEFHGFIAINETGQTVRVYFAASDQPWPPRPGVIITALKEDLKKGWKLKYHLHNHYGDKSDDYVGIMAPSLADAHYYKMLKKQYNVDKALITNGFNTVEISSSEFSKFESH